MVRQTACKPPRRPATGIAEEVETQSAGCESCYLPRLMFHHDVTYAEERLYSSMTLNEKVEFTLEVLVVVAAILWFT